MKQWPYSLMRRQIVLCGEGSGAHANSATPSSRIRWFKDRLALNMIL